MEVLISGLNSYLGKASMNFLPEEGYHVYGFVRDLNLVKSKKDLSPFISLLPMDLIRRGKDYDGFQVTYLDLGIYFTQIPDFHDDVAIQYELISLTNFVKILQKNGCNRILYVGRTYDKKYIEEIKQHLISLQVTYTILLKDAAVGDETSFSTFFSSMLNHKYIFLFNPTGTIKFRPFIMQDLFRWIKLVDWSSTFLNQEIEFGGPQLIELTSVFKEYISKRNKELPSKIKLINIKNKSLSQFLNKAIYGVHYDSYHEYIQNVSEGQFADNNAWQSIIPFEFTPLSL